jgi:hypothetical protein
MSASELKKTALWRWRLSTAAQALRRSEAHSRENAQDCLKFISYRRGSGVPAGL